MNKKKNHLLVKFPEKENKPVRINKYLAMCGLGSRRSTEKLILEGKILVNDQTVNKLHIRVIPQKDKVSLKKRNQLITIKPLGGPIGVFILNKPRGYLSSRKDPKNDSPTVFDLISKKSPDYQTVGRLDLYSAGLLLFTNDGELAYRLTHPSFTVERKYQVKLNKEFSENDLAELSKGIIIEGRKTLPPKISRINIKNRSLVISLKEGRNREIRRLFDSIGLKVAKLTRIQYGPIKLGNLPSGQGRFLKKAELISLYGLMDLR